MNDEELDGIEGDYGDTWLVIPDEDSGSSWAIYELESVSEIDEDEVLNAIPLEVRGLTWYKAENIPNYSGSNVYFALDAPNQQAYMVFDDYCQERHFEDSIQELARIVTIDPDEWED